MRSNARVSLAKRPSDVNATFGYRRYEVLAAFINGRLFVGMLVLIAIEAIRRFVTPATIAWLPMLIVEALGWVVNVIGLLMPHGSHGHNLNLHGTWLEVVADALGSVAVVIAAIIIWLTGWVYTDSVPALLLAAWITPWAWSLLSDAAWVLLEISPAGLDHEEIGKAMAARAGVTEVHDLHVRELSSDFPAASAHVLVGTDTDYHERSASSNSYSIHALLLSTRCRGLTMPGRTRGFRSRRSSIPTPAHLPRSVQSIRRDTLNHNVRVHDAAW